ncbi:MAG: hypothetical protein HN392_12575 [Anaerolineae bacterium]|nr:hypothetical protein [Anaerolineae bacterium]MBT3323110.1 hypothetical protein [Anaerolineae bacterium]
MSGALYTVAVGVVRGVFVAVGVGVKVGNAVAFGWGIIICALFWLLFPASFSA